MSHAGSSMVPDYIQKVLKKYYDQRDTLLKKVTTAETLSARQHEIREIYRDILGPFPERTALNVQQAGQIVQNGYTIEKLIYESQPQFYTTANLYRPEGEGPFPAMICPIGHWAEGKSYKDYQALGAGLARSGCIALVYDAPGMGERLTYYDPTLRGTWMGKTVTDDHTMVGNPCFLTGSHLAMHMIWNGMRGIDLLLEREDVDAEKIGCTGSSGGGTLTQFIAALDDRVKVAIPVCSTGKIRVIIGGDAEQNMFNTLSRGMCPADFYWAIAPRPLMIMTASGDNAYEGAQETLKEVQQAYDIMGESDRVSHVDIEGKHGYIEEMRQTTRRWLAKYWGTQNPPDVEEDVEVLPEQVLNCTETGQVSTSLGGETVFTLNRRLAETIVPTRPVLKTEKDAQHFQEKIRRQAITLSHFEAPQKAPEIMNAEGAHSERIVYQSEDGIEVPGLLFKPQGEGPHPGVVFVHEQGKDFSSTSNWPQSLVEAGLAVLTIDVRGIGETAPPEKRDDRHPYDSFLLGSHASMSWSSLFVGRSLFGRRIIDAIQGAAYMRSRSDIHTVSVMGTGAGGLMALYAGAFDEQIHSVAVHRGLYAYRALTSHRFYSHHLNLFLPGVLKAYDLGDVAGLIAPRPLLLINPVDEAHRLANSEDIDAEYKIAQDVYGCLESPHALTLTRTMSMKETFETVTTWTQKQ